MSRTVSFRAAVAISALAVFAVAGGALPAVATAPAPAVVAPASTSTLTADSTTITAGEKIVLSYTTDVPQAKNWIGIYPADKAPGDVYSIMWVYTPNASGTVSFTLELPAGNYRADLLENDGYEQLGNAVDFTVVMPEGAPVPGDPNAPVEIDPVVTTTATDGVLLRSSFDGGVLAEGWSTTVDASMVEAGDADYRGWSFTTRGEWSAEIDAMRDRFGRVNDTFLVADAAQFGADFNSTLRSPVVSVEGLAQVRLTFDSHFRTAEGQAGTVVARFDNGDKVELLTLDSTTVADYDLMQLNGAQDLVVPVPAGAKGVTFEWNFTAPAGGYYWGIDSVAVHQVLEATDAAPTTAWVVSDIQGHPQDLEAGIGFLNQHRSDASGLLMVGDIVNSGTVGEWAEIYQVMENTKDIRPETTVAAIGNHERYAAGGFAANRDRFLEFAERDRVWDEYVLEGAGGDLPVIVLGQEFAGPSEVAMTEDQVRFLEERLAYWTELDKQVLVITHFPLGNTVSGSWLPWYSTHHQHNDRLTSILGNYPNAIILTGHTHYSGEHGDWAMQRHTDDGHADGFWAVNTIAMHVGWEAVGESTGSISEIVTTDVNAGLVVDTYADRTHIIAYDFQTGERTRELVIPNPLVDFAAQLAPVVTPEPTAEPTATATATPTAEPTATATSTSEPTVTATAEPTATAPATGDVTPSAPATDDDTEPTASSTSTTDASTRADKGGAAKGDSLATTGAEGFGSLGLVALTALLAGLLLRRRGHTVE